ncbi:MAG: YidC/Oxa1 family membrane protein insertase [Clostridia bacterium]|nr:YidC/Oxa1 family membrane protein insertase [Clostridia bacterium]MDE7328600.1 YidC/Oxa1 family membrane protein insertase [Clostridia bacterium]
MAIMTMDTLAAVSSIWKPIISLLDWMNKGIGNFGWTVVVFTLLLRLILTPFDIWQKIGMRKQKAKMDALRPQMAKIQKQYANRPDILRQKQYELQKSAHINLFSSCLPMIFTLVIFALIFQGFRQYIISANEQIVSDLYNNVYVKFFIDNAQLINERLGDGSVIISGGQLTSLPSYELIQRAGLVEELNAALVDGYPLQSWLWVKNVFMSDTWANVIPNLDNFTSTSFGGVAATFPSDIKGVSYTELMQPILDAYNKTKFTDVAHWNGYLVLPLLSILTSFVSTMLQQKMQPNMQMATGDEAQQKQQKMMNKIMVYIMPLVLGIFAIVYSAAFAIYYFVSNLYMTIVSITFNLIAKKRDERKAAQPIIITAAQDDTKKKRK